MAPRRVINDSDDEGEAVSPELSPEKGSDRGIEAPKETSFGAIQPSGGIIGTSSTDPIFFQAVYDEQLAGFVTSIDSEPVPKLEDSVTNQRMSSSPVAARNPTRETAIQVSSATSISEPSASIRKVKRGKSIKALEDFTQVTTPIQSKDILKQTMTHAETNLSLNQDPWEFPGSSSGQFSARVNFKSRNALKGYGKMKRTKTMSAVPSSPAHNELKIRPLDDSDVLVNRKRSSRSQGDEDLLPLLPRAKRHKRRVSVNAETLTRSQDVSQNNPVTPSDPLDLVAASTSHTSILVPRTDSEEGRISGELPTSDICEKASLISTSCNSVVNQTHSTDNRSSKTEDATISLMIIPNTLTDSQKMQYNLVTVSSSNPEPGSSMPDISQLVNSRQPAAQLASVTMNTTSDTSKICSQIQERMQNQSSGNRASSPNRKMKRSKSEIASVAHPSKARTSPSKTSKGTRRTKSMTQKLQQQSRETSTDELSLDFSESVDFDPFNPSPKPQNKTFAEEPANADEAFGSAETEISMERHQSQLNARYSKSLSAQAIDSKVQGVLTPPRRGRPKIRKTISTADGLTDLTEAVADGNIETCLVHAELIKQVNKPSVKELETHPNDDTQHPLIDLETASVAMDQPLELKKKVRKRGAEKIAQPQKVSNSAQSSTNVVPSALQEVDINPQPKEPNTPSWNRTADFMLENTPTDVDKNPPEAVTPARASQKISDQHSPLQSGKVPYRVGLSRKTRIAPLLKIIRKDS